MLALFTHVGAFEAGNGPTRDYPHGVATGVGIDAEKMLVDHGGAGHL